MRPATPEPGLTDPLALERVRRAPHGRGRGGTCGFLAPRVDDVGDAHREWPSFPLPARLWNLGTIFRHYCALFYIIGMGLRRDGGQRIPDGPRARPLRDPSFPR